MTESQKKAGLNFASLDLEALQALLFPLIQTLTKFSVPQFLAGTPAESLGLAGNALHQAGELFDAAAAALADGRVTMEEVNLIVAEALDVPAAIDRLTELFTRPADAEAPAAAGAAYADPTVREPGVAPGAGAPTP